MTVRCMLASSLRACAGVVPWSTAAARPEAAPAGEREPEMPDVRRPCRRAAEPIDTPCPRHCRQPDRSALPRLDADTQPIVGAGIAVAVIALIGGIIHGWRFDSTGLLLIVAGWPRPARRPDRVGDSPALDRPRPMDIELTGARSPSSLAPFGVGLRPRRPR